VFVRAINGAIEQVFAEDGGERAGVRLGQPVQDTAIGQRELLAEVAGALQCKELLQQLASQPMSRRNKPRSTSCSVVPSRAAWWMNCCNSTTPWATSTLAAS